MPQIEKIAHSVIAALSSDANVLLAAQWVGQRYIELCSRARFEHLREVGELVIPASISAGTISVVRGQKAVTGDATAVALWSPLLRGRHIRLNYVWYEIEDINGMTLTLKSPYSDNDIIDGGYVIVPRFIRLENVRHIGAFRHSRRSRPVLPMPDYVLDMQQPRRDHVSASGPDVVCEIGSAKDSILGSGRPRLYEFYPYCKEAEVIHYVFYAVPKLPEGPEILTTYISDNIDEYILREGALIDHMKYKASKAADEGKIEQAAYWRNEYRMQETTWEKKIPYAIRADHSADDQTFILSKIGNLYGNRDVVTSRDQVWGSSYGGLL